MQKTCQKSADIGSFWFFLMQFLGKPQDSQETAVGKTCRNGDFRHVFAVFRYLIGPLVTKFFHILVEEVISFDLHGLTSKLDKNCLQK